MSLLIQSKRCIYLFSFQIEWSIHWEGGKCFPWWETNLKAERDLYHSEIHQTTTILFWFYLAWSPIPSSQGFHWVFFPGSRLPFSSGKSSQQPLATSRVKGNDPDWSRKKAFWTAQRFDKTQNFAAVTVHLTLMIFLAFVIQWVIPYHLRFSVFVKYMSYIS